MNIASLGRACMPGEIWWPSPAPEADRKTSDPERRGEHTAASNNHDERWSGSVMLWNGKIILGPRVCFRESSITASKIWLISSNAALLFFPFQAPVFSSHVFPRFTAELIQEHRATFTFQAVEGEEVAGPSGIDPGDEREESLHDLRPSKEIPTAI